MSKIPAFGSTYGLQQGLIPLDEAEHRPETGLPTQRKLSPPDLGFRPQVDLLLDRPHAETALDDWVRIDLEDPTLLEPGEFEEALTEALKTVKQALQGATGDELNALKRMDRLGSEVMEIRGMCDAMRRALYAG
jgi:hypothetical protein